MAYIDRPPGAVSSNFASPEVCTAKVFPQPRAAHRSLACAANGPSSRQPTDNEQLTPMPEKTRNFGPPKPPPLKLRTTHRVFDASPDPATCVANRAISMLYIVHTAPPCATRFIRVHLSASVAKTFSDLVRRLNAHFRHDQFDSGPGIAGKNCQSGPGLEL
jgi:hypothetical protein